MADIVEKVSGIGSMSERTDLNVSQQPARYISGLPQGQGQATYNTQTQAPMYAAPESEIVGITAGTQNPNQPITAGVDFGPGPGSEALPMAPMQPAPSLADTFNQLIKFDPSGDAELIYRRLVDEGY